MAEVQANSALSDSVPPADAALTVAAASRRSLSQVLGDGPLQVLGGGRGCLCGHPWVQQGLVRRQPGDGVHAEQASNEVFGQV